MPWQQGVRLNDHEGRLPGWELAGDVDKESAVTPGEGWAFGVSLEDNELLAQEGVFEDQFRFRAGKVQDGVEGQGLVVGLGSTTETLLDVRSQGSQASADEAQRAEKHGIPSWVGGGLDYTMNSWRKSKNVSVFWLLLHSPKVVVMPDSWER